MIFGMSENEAYLKISILMGNILINHWIQENPAGKNGILVPHCCTNLQNCAVPMCSLVKTMAVFVSMLFYLYAYIDT